MSFFLLPLLGATFNILKVVTIPGCMAFDSTDDANHTFVNMFAAQSLLRSGELPLINLFNNFGTPIIGDALTYPFSPHALSYWFLPYDVAMTVNRFAIGFLTILSLTIYYQRFMSRPSATICALLAAYTPGFIWHFAHHQYQAALLCLVVILFLHDRFLRQGQAQDFFFLCGGFIVLLLSLSLNVVAILVVFVIGHHLVESRGRIDSRLVFLLLALLSGVLFSAADTLSFLHYVQESVRVTQGYQGAHLLASSHIFAPVVGLALVGLAFLFASPPGACARVFFLGVLPTAVVFVLITYPALWQATPLLRSTDISRVWWVSNVFLLIGVGAALDALRRPAPRMQSLALLIYVLCVVEVVSIVSADRHLFIAMSVGLLVLAFYVRWLLTRGDDVGLRRLATVNGWAIGILACFFPLYFAIYNVLGYVEPFVCRPAWFHHFSPRRADLFSPRSFIRSMEPFSRVAVEAESWRGFDLKITRDHMFGAGGRSIVLNERFMRVLLAHDLVTVDQVPAAYHFKRPWEAEKLRDLGIRYVMQEGSNEEAVRKGWKESSTTDRWSLYENPLKTSVVFLVGAGGRTTTLDRMQVSFRGNGVQVRLPELHEPKELVATFVAWRGWRGYVDGRERHIYSGGDQLIRVGVSPGEREVNLRFQPFGWRHAFGGIGLSLLIPTMVCLTRLRR